MAPPVTAAHAVGAAQSPGRGRWKESLRGLILFALLGPPLGGLLVALAIGITETWQGNLQGEGMSNWLAILGLALVFSYPFGVVPAAVTGLMVGWLRPRLVGWRAATTGALLGGVFTIVGLLLVTDKDFEPGMLLGGLIGAIPGALLAHRFFAVSGTSSRSTHPIHTEPPVFDGSRPQ